MSVIVLEINLAPESGPALSQETKLAILTAVGGVGGPMNGAKISPYLNNFTPDPVSVIGDFDLISPGGFTPQTLTWNPAGTEGEFGATLIANSVDWTVAVGDSVTIYGFVITDTTGADVLGYARLDSAYPVVPGMVFSVVVTVNLE